MGCAEKSEGHWGYWKLTARSLAYSLIKDGFEVKLGYCLKEVKICRQRPRAIKGQNRFNVSRTGDGIDAKDSSQGMTALCETSVLNKI